MHRVLAFGRAGPAEGAAVAVRALVLGLKTHEMDESAMRRDDEQTHIIEPLMENFAGAFHRRHRALGPPVHTGGKRVRNEGVGEAGGRDSVLRVP